MNTCVYNVLTCILNSIFLLLFTPILYKQYQGRQKYATGPISQLSQNACILMCLCLPFKFLCLWSSDNALAFLLYCFFSNTCTAIVPIAYSINIIYLLETFYKSSYFIYIKTTVMFLCSLCMLEAWACTSLCFWKGIVWPYTIFFFTLALTFFIVELIIAIVLYYIRTNLKSGLMVQQQESSTTTDHTTRHHNSGGFSHSTRQQLNEVATVIVTQITQRFYHFTIATIPIIVTAIAGQIWYGLHILTIHDTLYYIPNTAFMFNCLQLLGIILTLWWGWILDTNEYLIEENEELVQENEYIEFLEEQQSLLE